MSLLQDQRCDAALTQLNDAICYYERVTGREYALILVPFSPDEQMLVSFSGKAMDNLTGLEALAFALRSREGG